jgi:hypothetical protein
VATVRVTPEGLPAAGPSRLPLGNEAMLTSPVVQTLTCAPPSKISFSGMFMCRSV